MKAKLGAAASQLPFLMTLLWWFAITLFCVSALAQAEPRATMTMHVPAAVSSGLAPLVGHAPASERLSLAISLPLRNQAELEDLLQQIYERESPNFHKYLSVEEFTERFGPSEADQAAVLAFAQEHGLDVIDIPVNRMVVDVEGFASDIEGAFHISLGVYQHPTESRTFYAPDREPTLDMDVPLLHISGLDDFALPRPKFNEYSLTPKPAPTAKGSGSGPGGSYLGSDLRAAYYGSGGLNGAGQSVAIFSLKGYELSDVQHYFSSIHQKLNVPIIGVSVNGASLNCPPASCNDGEQSLDMEQAISMAPGLSSLRFYVGKSNVSVFNQMAADNISKSISCSWGWADNESSLDPIFEEMGAQGQSVFVATGDNGSGTPADVVWPADDPYVTAVGGTVLSTNGPGGTWKGETGWDNSAGGPSPNKVPIPSYQLLAGVITSSNGASSTLRNIPDVSSESNASQYNCAQGICADHGGGTSYAAPLWASLIAMVNEQAASNNESSVGFFNPALYDIGVGATFATDFHDITNGSNGGYSAVVGYDLVTGWGSPQGVNLINALAPPK
ncbi:MAG: protease pro-enzyme activation domain-containing protein [Candidatus Sulfotelmatobacter sp.]